MFAILYLVCFALIAGASFALMTQGIQASRTPTRPRPASRPHPEAPRPGEPVMALDLSRERLERLYQESSPGDDDQPGGLVLS